jgi:5-methylcytosine-specific restriction endonuclease McrA
MPKRGSPIKITHKDGTTEVRTAASFRKQPYWKSNAWKQLRAAALRRDDYRCGDCKRQRGDEDPRLKRGRTQLEVHHVTYDRYGSERLEDLQTLCAACHSVRHQWLRYRPETVPQ